MGKPPLLLVCARGGPPLSDVIPRVASVTEPHVLKLAEPPPGAESVIDRHCASVTDSTGEDLHGEALVDHIVAVAKSVSAEGVLSFSEFAVIAAAKAADRLDLPGPGRGVIRARNKRLMRAAWAEAGVPIPRFQPVDTATDLYRAWERLTPPILLKSAWGAGSIGQVVIDRRAAVPEAFGRARTAIRQALDAQMSELYAPEAGDELIAEEIVVADRSSWHDDPRYADYLSVEGLVVDGVCHSVCITERLPTLAPFVERGNLAPSALAPAAQRVVAEVVREAVESLGLGTCGTHTELKLLPDGEVRLIETAARFGGHLLTRQVEVAYGFDLVTALTEAAVGHRPRLPDRMLVPSGGRAAGTVNMIAADSLGRRWSTSPVYAPDRLDLGSLVSPGSSIEVVPDFTVTPGTRMAAYEPSRGSLNLAGVCYLEAPDAETLVRDAYSVMDGLEAAMAAAW
jgi:biotin carboxylase